MGKGWQRICPRQENGIYFTIVITHMMGVSFKLL